MSEQSEEIISRLEESAIFKQLRFEWTCQIKQLKHLITQLEAENERLKEMVTCKHCGGEMRVKDFHCGCWYGGEEQDHE